MVASRIGGIQDQIEDGTSGILVDDPRICPPLLRQSIPLLEDRERAAAPGMPQSLASQVGGCCRFSGWPSTTSRLTT